MSFNFGCGTKFNMLHGHIVKTKRIGRRLSSKKYCSKGNVFYNLRSLFFIRIVKEKKLLPVVYRTVQYCFFQGFLRLLKTHFYPVR